MDINYGLIYYEVHYWEDCELSYVKRELNRARCKY